MSLKLKSSDEFKTLLVSLWDDLLFANIHFLIFQEIGRSGVKRIEEINISPVFWRLTIEAHAQMALVRLLRVYDQHKAGLHLLRLLQTVHFNQWLFTPDQFRKRLTGNPSAEEWLTEIGVLDLTQLEKDIHFVSTANPKVENLKQWRDRVTFHKDPRHILTGKPFEQKNPLPYADIEELIKKGFEILNRYSLYFDANRYGETLPKWDDVNFVIEALRFHPIAVRLQQDIQPAENTKESEENQ
jgi:hypothetical protein